MKKIRSATAPGTRFLLTVLASACAALALAGTASAGLQIGVVEDGVRGANATTLLSQMNDVGMTQVRVTVLWDPAAPTTIPDQAEIEQMLPFAQARGTRSCSPSTRRGRSRPRRLPPR